MNIAESGSVPPPMRHCGRCQQEFDADPSLFFQTEWALCPACAEILLPKRRNTPVVLPPG